LSSAVKRLIWWVFTGSRGGPNRARLVVAVKETPMNANQIATHLGMDYKTVKHHLHVLLKNHLIVEAGEGYGAMYFVSPELEQNYDEFLRIWAKIGGT
jgi:DNA-binding transcriptional ArsR family regulator